MGVLIRGGPLYTIRLETLCIATGIHPSVHSGFKWLAGFNSQLHELLIVQMLSFDYLVPPFFFVSLARAEYDQFQIELAKNYGVNEWREDLRRVMMKAGLENNPVVFLFSDTQVSMHRPAEHGQRNSAVKA